MADVKIKPPTSIQLTADGDLYLVWDGGNMELAVSMFVSKDCYHAGALHSGPKQLDKEFFLSSLRENFKEEDAL